MLLQINNTDIIQSPNLIISYPISYYIISYRILSRIISYRIISCHVISRRDISYHLLFLTKMVSRRFVFSHPILSRYVRSYHPYIASRHIVSYHIASRQLMSVIRGINSYSIILVRLLAPLLICVEHGSNGMS